MAMASAFVDGALQDMMLLASDFFRMDTPRGRLRDRLRNLRTFLLYARGGCSSGPIRSLLSRLEDSLIQNGKDFHNLCLRQKDTGSLDDLLQGVVNQLNNCIASFSKEIMESYNTLSEYWSRQSRCPSKEFLRSLIENMYTAMMFVVNRTSRHEILIQAVVKALNYQLEFFINFFRFAEFRGSKPGQLQVLVTRLHFVAVNAAILCFRESCDPFKCTKEFSDELRSKFSELLLKVKPIDPQIHETYVHVLTASNVSRSSHALTLETDKHVLGDFVESLLCRIVEALSDGDSYMVSLKDQVPILHEGLLFLRTILTKHLEKIDELHKKAKDLIGTAVNEAAIVICSPPVHEWEEGLVKEINFALHSFLERIKLIKVITSAFIFSKSNDHGFIDFLLENLKELPSCTVDSIAFAKDQIQTLQEDFVSLRSFWESNLDDRKHDGKLQSLWKRVVEVAYETHFVILSLVVRDIPNCSLLEFRTIIEEINLIRLESLKIVDNHCDSDSEAQKATNTSTPLPSQGSTPAIDKIMVPLKDEEEKIIEHLTRGSNTLDIISIVGMPGLGKTTLAKSVYDNPSVRDQFHTSAWCVVSQAYKKKDLLLRILGSVDPSFSGHRYSEKNEQWLEESLRKSLLRKRYLIVLDDVWDIEAWSALERSFPDNANSSRILLTSRDSEVAKKINPNREPHPLRQLKNNECLDLLEKKLSWIKSSPVDLMEIAKRCRGLPLTVVIVAGILANSEQDGWEEITRRLSLSALSNTDQCIDILELSFRKLPENLKSCLLYFGLFPEDQEISVRDLIWLWIAEGFIEKSEQKSLKDVAMDCINHLISRSLVMVSQKRSIGGVKTCKIHDLLHEFYVKKSKKEKFLSLSRGRDELFTFLGQRDLQRLSMHSSAQDLEESKLSCPGVRSLLFFDEESDFRLSYHISFIFHFFKLLKVLALENINLGFTFPVEIALLVELRYLAIGGDFRSIPSAIANLSNLETLLLCGFQHGISLPDTVWNMPKLRVLRSFSLALFIDNLESSSDLHNLDTFSKLFCSTQSLEKILRKLPNIRRLKCELYGSGESNADCNGIVSMDFLSRLESLHLGIFPADEYHGILRFPVNLKKLTLSDFNSRKIPKGGELPNLMILKLKSIDFEGDTWDMSEEWEFPNLKYLELDNLRINRWTGTDGADHFLCLEKLVLKGCWKLKEVPSCLGDITTLQMIEVNYCSKLVANLIMQIKEDQKDNWGNEDLQVLVINA